jgi:hypothetical protein
MLRSDIGAVGNGNRLDWFKGLEKVRIRWGDAHDAIKLQRKKVCCQDPVHQISGTLSSPDGEEYNVAFTFATSFLSRRTRGRGTFRLKVVPQIMTRQVNIQYTLRR